MTRTLRSLLAASSAGIIALAAVLGAAQTASAEPGARAGQAVQDPLRLYAVDPASPRLLSLDPATGESSDIVLPDAGGAVVAQADGSTLYVRTQSGSVAVVDVATAKTTAEWPGHGGWSTSPSALALSDDGARLAVAGGNTGGCTVDLLDTDGGEMIRRFTAPSSWCTVSAVALSADGTRLFATDKSSNSLFVFDIATGALLGQLDKYADPDRMHNNPNGLALSRDGKSLAVSFGLPNWRSEPSIVVLDAQTLEWRSDSVLEERVPGTRGAGQLTVSPNTGNIQAGIGDYSPVIWSVDPQQGRIAGAAEVTWVGNAGIVAGRGDETYAATGDGIVVLGADGAVLRTIETPGVKAAGLAVVDGRPPVASLRDGAGTVGTPVSLTAEAESGPGTLPIASYAWDFGDGETETSGSPTIEHRYERAGTYAVSVTLTDVSGSSTTRVYDGSRVVRNGSGSARAEAAVVVSSATVEPPVPPVPPVPPGNSGSSASGSSDANGGAGSGGAAAGGAADASTGGSDGDAADAAGAGNGALASTGQTGSGGMLLMAATLLCAGGAVWGILLLRKRSRSN